MEIAKIELAALEQAASKQGETLVQLSDLELALVGGGVGEVLFG